MGNGREMRGAEPTAARDAEPVARPGKRTLPDEVADAQIADAARAGQDLNAWAYLHLYIKDVRRGIGAWLASRRLSTGDPHVAFAAGPDAFVDELAKPFDTDDDTANMRRLQAWLAPADVFAIVDRNRPIFDAGAHVDAPTTGVKIVDDELRRRELARPSAAHRAKGPPTWAAGVATAIASVFEEKLVESLRRVSARLAGAVARRGRLAGVNASEVVPSTPLDWQVAQAMLGRDGDPPTVTVTGGAATAAPTYRRVVRVEWQGARGGPWNAVRALDPPDATLEEIAAHLLGSPAEAYRLQRIGDDAIVPESAATAFPAAVHGRERTGGWLQPSAEAQLAFGPRAMDAVSAEAARGAPASAAAPDAAGLDGRWVRVEEQLRAIAIAVEPYGLADGLASALALHRAHRSELAALAGRDAAVRGAALDRQRELLARIAAELGPLAGGPPTTAGADPVHRTLAALVRAASLSHLAETGRAAYAAVAAVRRAAMFEPLEAALGEAAAKIEAARQIGERAVATTKASRGATRASFGTRADELRVRVADLRSRSLHGALEPAQLSALAVEIEALRVDAGLVAQIGALGTLFDTIDALESSGWVVVSEALTESFVDVMTNGPRLVALRAGAFALREDLKAVHASWVALEARSAAISDGLARAGAANADVVARDAVAAEVAALRAKLRAIGGDERVRAFLVHAHDTCKSAARRATFVQIATMVGVTVLSAGAAELAAGVAEGLGFARTAVSLTRLATESATFTALNGLLSDEPLVHAFTSTFVGNLATFGAVRAAKAYTVTTWIGRTVRAGRGAGVAATAMFAGARLADLGATTLVAAGVQFAQAEYESLRAQGRTLSLDELTDAGVRGMAMMIGAAFVHHGAGEALDDLSTSAARAVAKRRARSDLRALERRVAERGDPLDAFALLDAEREAMAADAAATADLAKLPDADLRARGLSRDDVRLRAQRDAASLATLDDLESVHVLAQLGLDAVVPGRVYAGEPARLAAVVARATAQGYRAEPADGGFALSKGADHLRLLAREPGRAGAVHDEVVARKAGADQHAHGQGSVPLGKVLSMLEEFKGITLEQRAQQIDLLERLVTTARGAEMKVADLSPNGTSVSAGVVHSTRDVVIVSADGAMEQGLLDRMLASKRQLQLARAGSQEAAAATRQFDAARLEYCSSIPMRKTAGSRYATSIEPGREFFVRYRMIAEHGLTYADIAAQRPSAEQLGMQELRFGGDARGIDGLRDEASNLLESQPPDADVSLTFATTKARATNTREQQYLVEFVRRWAHDGQLQRAFNGFDSAGVEHENRAPVAIWQAAATRTFDNAIRTRDHLETEIGSPADGAALAKRVARVAGVTAGKASELVARYRRAPYEAALASVELRAQMFRPSVASRTRENQRLPDVDPATGRLAETFAGLDIEAVAAETRIVVEALNSWSADTREHHADVTLLGMTVHAGEQVLDVDPFALLDQVDQAVSLGADRLGHALVLGVDADVLIAKRRLARERKKELVARQQQVIERVRARGVVIEANLSSNAELSNLTHDEHPAATFVESGLRVTVNTDDETLLGTNLREELRAVAKARGIERRDMIVMILESYRSRLGNRELAHRGRIKVELAKAFERDQSPSELRALADHLAEKFHVERATAPTITLAHVLDAALGL